MKHSTLFAILYMAERGFSFTAMAARVGRRAVEEAEARGYIRCGEAICVPTGCGRAALAALREVWWWLLFFPDLTKISEKAAREMGIDMAKVRRAVEASSCDGRGRDNPVTNF